MPPSDDPYTSSNAPPRPKRHLTRTKRGMAPIDRVALVLMAGLVILLCLNIRAKNPIENPPGPIGHVPEFAPARVRVCRAVRRLHAHQHHHHHHKTPGAPSCKPPSLPALYPELFEYMGLDPDTAPGQAAVSKAWTARLADLVPVGGGGASGEGGLCDDACKLTTAAAVKESMLKGFDGGIIEEEGMIHTVASVLWEDDSRAEYIDQILPILRPPASRILIFKRADAGGFEAMCPRD
ncbi:hypothetical protein EsH8_XII_000044 [Colletotrichum jinshuiense]